MNNTGKFIKGCIPWNKGKECPYLLGNKNGFQKGGIPWNKGKPHMQGKNHPMFGKKLPRYIKDAISKANKGKPAWNKGKILYHLRGKNSLMFGKHLSKKIRMKISIAHKGKFLREKHPRWKGGKYLSDGYICILYPTHPFHDQHGYIREHRLIVEKCLGRFLQPSEECHHVNHSRGDNRIENLMLFKGKSSHRRFERGGIVKPEEIIFDGRKFSH